MRVNCAHSQPNKRVTYKTMFGRRFEHLTAFDESIGSRRSGCQIHKIPLIVQTEGARFEQMMGMILFPLRVRIHSNG